MRSFLTRTAARSQIRIPAQKSSETRGLKPLRAFHPARSVPEPHSDFFLPLFIEPLFLLLLVRKHAEKRSARIQHPKAALTNGDFPVGPPCLDLPTFFTEFRRLPLRLLFPVLPVHRLHVGRHGLYDLNLPTRR